MPPTPLPRNPLRNYQFRVAVIEVVGPGGTPSGGDLTYVAGVRTVSGLRASVAAVETWEGGNALHRYANPGKVTWEPIGLEQGLALDSTFEDWARAVLDFAATGKKPMTGLAVKRQVIIDVWDENSHPDGPPSIAPPPRPSPSQISPFSANLKVDIKTQGSRYKRFHIHNAWISKYMALPKLDSMTSEVALLSVELMHEGWTESIVV